MTIFQPPLVGRGILAIAIVSQQAQVTAQEDFRNRPWRDLIGTTQEITISDEGVLLSELPQYVFHGTMKGSTVGDGVNFRLLDAKGGIPATIPAVAGSWSAGFNARWAIVADKIELRNVFTKAGWNPDAYQVLISNPALPSPHGSPAFPENISALTDQVQTTAQYRLQYVYGKARPEEANWQDGGVLDAAKGEKKFTFAAGNFGPMRFSIKREVGPWPGHVQAWLKVLKDRHSPEIKAGRAALLDREKEINDLLRDLAAMATADCDRDMPARWNALKIIQQTTYDAHNRLTAQWQIEWLWYTKGRLGMDPFGLKSLELPPDTIGLAALKEKGMQLQKELDCCKGGERTVDDIDAIVKARNDVRKAIDAHLAAIKKYDEWLKTNAAALSLARAADVRLYDGLLYVSTKDTARYMLHLDAAKDFGRMNKIQREEYYDFEERHYLVHNYTGDVKALALEQTGVKVEHAPSIADDVNSALTGLDGLVASAGPSTGAFNPWFAQLGGGLVPLAATPCDKVKEEALATLGLLKRCNARLDTMETILSVQPMRVPSCAFSFEPPSKGDVKAQQHVTYTLLKKGEKDEKATTIATGSYDLWKLHCVQLFGGLAWSAQDLARTTIVETGGTIDIKRENERLGFLIGLKVHPWGAEIDDDRFLFHERRLSLMAGMGLPTPLNDLYAGVGYDVYPGVQLGVLAHWYRNESATIQNNKVIERRNVYSDPVLAFALTLDTSLFTNLLKLFAP